MIFNYLYTDQKRVYLNERNKRLINSEQVVEMVLFGDSILEGYDISRYFPSSKLIINSAVGGDRLPYMVQRLEQDVLALKPKEMLFLGGINDIRAWQTADRTVEEVPTFVAELVNRYSQVISKAQAHNITVHPILITNNQEHKHNYTFINYIVNLLNIELKKLESTLNVKFIDFNQVLCNEYGTISLDLTSDGLHPNELGYLKITDLLIEKDLI
ncbi:GDSL-type esterase/lipase family protein [Mollicutes bacterium LVI A0078]|nr:GDSL-type esterase/lipase family protein [Mollicutes bacterium LVI A0075]WOO90728.1 GDSL-type esterase/lipase family protein [Mollicutes bacterium LVI A0078]